MVGKDSAVLGRIDFPQIVSVGLSMSLAYEGRDDRPPVWGTSEQYVKYEQTVMM